MDQLLRVNREVRFPGDGNNLGTLPHPVVDVVNNMGAIHQLTVDSALTGDRKLAMKALMIDPLMKDFKNAGKLLEEMLNKQRRFLPRLFK